MVKSQIRALQKNLQYRFKNAKLLELALTHPSFVQGTDQSDSHNQRLEFLGDAILDMIVAVELYKTYPDKREGFLTKARSTICHGKNLTQMGRDFDLDQYLQLGKGEQRAKSKNRSQVIGDCLEAIIGAIYLDGGYKSARKMVLKWVRSQMGELEKEMLAINFKGSLQEWSQSHFGTNLFEYQLLKTEGPDHAKQFVIQLSLQNHPVSMGTGFSKKEAESEAAEQALKKIRTDEKCYLKLAESPHDSFNTEGDEKPE